MSQSKLVLIVDDELEILSLLSEEMRTLGHQTQSARSADEALALIKSQKFDLIITDFVMPGKSGLDLIQSVRDLKFTLPVILLLTCMLSEPNAIEGLDVKAVLSKPFDYDHLAKIIKELLD